MQRVAVLADSRGLDTYYLNARYPRGYGVDAVFATRLDRRLIADGSGDAHLIPDHFRAGSAESRILRLALTDPSHVLLCDGIWETLLNREKYFAEASALGALEAGLFGREDAAAREEAGRVLTELFLAGRLSVSPARYEAQLDHLIGYFARRRRAVAWLSLPAPPADHRGGRHYAGDYRPLPRWEERLAAVNAAAARALARWGGAYINLDPLLAAAGGAEAALIDLWHFSAPFHDRVAAHLVERMNQDWRAPAALADPTHLSRAVLIPGRCETKRLVAFGGGAASDEPAGPDVAALDGLRDTVLVVDLTEEERVTRGPELLRALHPSVVLAYPDEIGAADDPSGPVED